MNLTQSEWLVVALLCTVSLLIGWLSAMHERRVDAEIASAESFQQHWASVLWVVRRPTPVPDETVAS